MKKQLSRRRFLTTSASAGITAPFLWTGRVSGAVPANNRITVGAIGTGRMGRGNLGDILGYDEVQVVAVCDVDRVRRDDAQKMVHDRYKGRTAKGDYEGCDTYSDFREVVTRPDIDAVLVVTPDHWHALPAIEAAKNGKDIFVQKPMTYTIHEGRVLADTVKRYGRVLQVGSQQRSDQKFRFGCELVRNGRIGKLLKVEVGCGVDPGMGAVAPTDPPLHLDYNFWLGPAPSVPYVEQRVHPKSGYGRPGWLRTRDYCVGMMTGWGSHHMDIAHWGMGMEDSGPSEIYGWAEYRDGTWDVHGLWDTRMVYANGVELFFGDNKRYAQGATFYGTEGKVYVRRGHLSTEPASLIHETMGPHELHLYESKDHMGNFVDCIKSRAETVAPVENGHRSNTACILSDISARLGRPLAWDPVTETFRDDETANRMISRPMRAPWHV